MTTSTSKAHEKSLENERLDALTILRNDHKKVLRLFASFEKMKDSGSPEEKESLIQELCTELVVHAALEEELFYPPVRKALDDEEMMDEAVIEHATAKELIAQIEAMDSETPMFNAKIKVLGEYIQHHITEEQGEMFPKVKKTNLDLESLGAKILKRKKVLLAERETNKGMAHGEILIGFSGK